MSLLHFKVKSIFSECNRDIVEGNLDGKDNNPKETFLFFRKKTQEVMIDGLWCYISVALLQQSCFTMWLYWRVRFCACMLLICTLHVFELQVGYILMKRSKLHNKTAMINVFICELSMKFTNSTSDSTSM